MTVLLHVDMVLLHVDMVLLHFDMVLLLVDMFLLHVDMLLFYGDMLLLHVDMLLFHVHYSALVDLRRHISISTDYCTHSLSLNAQNKVIVLQEHLTTASL